MRKKSSESQLTTSFYDAFLQLGRGLFAHPDNTHLREQVGAAILDMEHVSQQLLGVVLRWGVLLHAARMGRLWEPGVPSQRQRVQGFSFAEAFHAGGSWDAHLHWLGALDGANLGVVDRGSLPPLEGELWNLQAAMPDLLGTSLDQESFQAAASLLYAATAVPNEDMGAEVGNAFSRMLGWRLQWDVETESLAMTGEIGSTRRSSGSYYTPPALVGALLDQTLAPILTAAMGRGAAHTSSLGPAALRICDPACGAGHFLVAVARRIAASIDDDELLPSVLEHIVSGCVYGVDLQPWAVSICRWRLWMLTSASLGFWSRLTHNIKCGNSLFGATPEALRSGIPDGAIRAIADDAPKAVVSLRALNKRHRTPSQPTLSFGFEDKAPTSLAVDAWCAAFVCEKKPGAPALTNQEFEAIQNGAGAESASTLAQAWATRHRFLHWHLAFPGVFGSDVVQPGFHLVVGNPPWERIKLQEREYFAARIPEIATAKRAVTRRTMIAALAETQPRAFAAYMAARRDAEGMGHFVRNSGLYPMSGRGDINLYTCFIELSQRLIRDDGVVGLLVPSGIATDHTTQAYFSQLIETQALCSLSDFENTLGYFPDVSARFRFCMLQLRGPQHPSSTPPSFLFFARRIEELNDDTRRFQLSADQLALLNPNTRTCPIFRSAKDATLTLRMYEAIPVLWDDKKPDPPLRFVRMFDMTNDSGLFRTPDERASLVAPGDTSAKGSEGSLEGPAFLPLYEGKMFEPFDHRFADVITTDNVARPGQPQALTLEEHKDPTRFARPQYFVSAKAVKDALSDWDAQWFLAFKDVTAPTNSRTFLATILPYAGVSNSAPVIQLLPANARLAACLCANINAFAFDYIARQKISSLHMNYFIVKQLPFVPWSRYAQPCPWETQVTLEAWLVERVVQLVYSADDLVSFAKDCGVARSAAYDWDEEARFELRCELDAAMFHLYGLGKQDVLYIMSTFPVIEKRDRQVFNDYRTRDRIVALYEELEEREGGKC